MEFLDWLARPWPWWVAGPLLGLFAPALLLLGNKAFGISANLRHVCSIVSPRGPDFFRYDWRKEGGWNLLFFAGIGVGGLLTAGLFPNPEPIAIAPATIADLGELGVEHTTGLLPPSLFGWQGLASLPGLLLMVGGGFLVGFGARYAGGCTSGHGIAGLAQLQLPSLIAVIGFFLGGMLASFGLLPLVLGS